MPDHSIFTTYNLSAGYRPTHSAKKIRRKKIFTIGVIVHRLDSYLIASALKGIEETVAGAGFELIVTNSQECIEKEVANARLLYEGKVDGVIASLSFGTKNIRHFSAFETRGVPIVFFDRVAETGDCDSVVIDNAGCGFLATEHLIRQGCNRIAIITSKPERNVYAQRYKGYRDALEKYDIPFTSELLILRGQGENGGDDAARVVSQMKRMPDGLFITNDLTAAMCMQSLKESGIRVPEDIAIVGFNNDPIGRLTTPMLTTIDYPGYEMGKKAAANLLDHLTGRRSTVQSKTTIIPSGLIARKSSLKAVHTIN